MSDFHPAGPIELERGLPFPFPEPERPVVEQPPPVELQPGAGGPLAGFDNQPK